MEDKEGLGLAHGHLLEHLLQHHMFRPAWPVSLHNSFIFECSVDFLFSPESQTWYRIQEIIFVLF